jgi:hypothetical protein
MSSHDEILYTLDGRPSNALRNDGKVAGRSIPRIARLMALAIRFDGLLRNQTIRDYAQLARLRRVTRTRVTQIMRLLDLAPDIQEQILFLPLASGINERNLRPVVSRIDWNEQRHLFQNLQGATAVCRTRSGGCFSSPAAPR